MPVRLYAFDIGGYVVDCDVNAHDGRGCVRFGPKKDAMVFPDARAALTYWQRQSQAVPLRDDGKPNRPLTAHSIAVEKFTEE